YSGRRVIPAWLRDTLAALERATREVPGLTRARLYPDYGGSPLWLPNRRVEWEELQLPPPLRARLEDWLNAALHNTGPAISDETFDSEGLELARLLSDELDWTVVYEG